MQKRLDKYWTIPYIGFPPPLLERAARGEVDDDAGLLAAPRGGLADEGEGPGTIEGVESNGCRGISFQNLRILSALEQTLT